ncbi:hypothetical protein [Sphingomonas sp.]|uniref:hypothetical protein n=1 Tax=Sphingomonas sp. TaxID=28214 RepID=UPI003CC52CEF
MICAAAMCLTAGCGAETQTTVVDNTVVTDMADSIAGPQPVASTHAAPSSPRQVERLAAHRVSPGRPGPRHNGS